MIIQFILIIFLQALDISKANLCFAPILNDQNTCRSCEFTRFHNGTFEESQFSVFDCHPKENITFLFQHLVLAPNSKTKCADCLSKSIDVKQDFFESLINISEQCKGFFSCEGVIYLEASSDENPHILKILNFKEYFLFRRMNVSLVIQPLWCGILGSDIPCAADKNYFQQVLLKSGLTKFFISGSFLIKNIIWDGSDLMYNQYNDPCFNTSKCCSKERMETPLDSCNYKGQSVAAETSNGLFNLELIIDFPEIPTPFLGIYSSSFINFYATGESKGFTSLIKTTGIYFYNISLFLLKFENVFFLEGLFSSYYTIESFRSDPIYETFTIEKIKDLIKENFGPANIRPRPNSLLISGLSFLNYNALEINESSTHQGGVLLRLYDSVLVNVFVENIELLNFKNQTCNHLYLFSFLTEIKESTIILKNLTATNITYFSFLFINSTPIVIISNIRINRWILINDNSLFYFRNISLLRVDGVTFYSVLSSLNETRGLLISNCLLSQINNIVFNGTIGLSFKITQNIYVNFTQIFANECQYRDYLFYAESSTFSLNGAKINKVFARDLTKSAQFSSKLASFNLSDIYINSISGQAIFDYREAQIVYIDRFRVENITGVRTIFYFTTTFQTSFVNEFVLCNSVVPRFSEFQTNNLGYNPNLLFTRIKLSNIVLPALNSDFFASFRAINLIVRDSVFVNIRRIDYQTIVPYAIIYCPYGVFEFFNCTFKSVGYSFAPREMHVPNNYALILISLNKKYSIRYCYFEADEFVSLNGFIVSGFVSLSSEVTNCKFTVKSKNPKFIYRALALAHSLSINFINNTFSNFTYYPFSLYNQLLHSGSALIFGEDSFTFLKNSKKLELHNLSFENCDFKNGGAFHISNYHFVNISNLFFQNNYALSGGSWAIVSSSNITAINITILLSHGEEAASIFFSDIVLMSIKNYKEFFVGALKTGSWKIKNSKIICNEIFVFNASSEKSGGFINLHSSTTVITKGKLIFNLAKEYGGAFFVTLASDLIINESSMENSISYFGGLVSANDANSIIIKNTLIKNASANLNGASIYFEFVISSLFENLTILQANAINNGIIYIKSTDDTSTYNMSQLYCQDKVAKIGSCVYFYSASKLFIFGISINKCSGVAISIRNDLPKLVTLNNLYASNVEQMEYLLGIERMIVDLKIVSIQACVFTKSIFNIKFSKVYFHSLNLYNNSCSNDFQTLHSFFATSSDISILRINFQNPEKSQTVLLKVLLSNVTLLETTIEGGYGTEAVINLESSFFFGRNLLFKQNLITCIEAAKSNVTLLDVEFLKNKGSVEQPSDISIKNSFYVNNYAYLENVSSKIETPQLLIDCQNFQFLRSSNSSFSVINDKGESDSYQGMIIKNIFNVQIEKVNFTGFQAVQGSGAQISATAEFKSVVLIEKSFFSNCTSYIGGALSLINLQEIKISNNSFFHNKANFYSDIKDGNAGVAGVGIILCLTSGSKNCSISIENNSFKSNFAKGFGPLFVSNFSVETEINNSFENNTDASFFSDYSVSFPPLVFINLPAHDPSVVKSLEMKNYNDTNDTLFYDIQNLTTIFEVKSGKPFKFELILTDSKAQPLVFDNNSTCTLESPLFANHQIKLSNNILKASNGKFLSEELKLFYFPNSSANLSITIKIPKNLILNSEPITLSYLIVFYFKPCVPGEIILSDLSCFTCPEGTFSSIDPMIGFDPANVLNTLKKCEHCSEKSICLGGAYNFPRPSFWRPFENSTKFIECPIPEACEGPGKFLMVNLLGKCAKGHFGILCNDCVFGFGKLNTNFLCQPCEITNRGAITRFVLALIFITSYIVGGAYIYSINSEKLEKRDILLVYLKISLSFTQIVNLFGGIKFTWVLPSMAKILSMSSNSISFATEDILLNDCIIQGYLTDIENLYAVKAVVIIFLPIVMALFASFFWISYYYMLRMKLPVNLSKKEKKNPMKMLQRRICASFLISIFLFHPLIIRSSFNMMNCFPIDEDDPNSEAFLFIYPNFRCWTSFHYKIIFIFAAPSIAIWGLIFPLFLLCILIKQRGFKLEKAIRKEIKRGSEKNNAKIKNNLSNLQPYRKKSLSFSNKKNSVVALDVTSKNNLSLKRLYKNEYSNNFKKNGILNSILNSNIFKFLYKGYKKEYSYWQCINFLKKLFISLLINQNQIIGYDVTVMIVLLILSLSIWVQYRFHPLISDKLNIFEILSLVGVFMIFVSMVVLSTRTPSSTQYFFTVLIFAIYLIFGCFLIILLYRFFQLIGTIVIHKSRALFKSLM